MLTVNTEVEINAPIDKVYEIAKDNEKFPEFMSDVKSVKIINSQDSTVTTEWVGVVPTFGIKVSWTQEDIWDDKNHTCKFKQIEGDYDFMEGEWRFLDVNGKTRFESTVNYEYIVPGLGPLVKKVIHKLVIKNLENVLTAIKGRAES